MKPLIALLTLLVAGGPALAAGTTPAGGALAPPVRIEAGNGPIDVDVGHAAPHVVDWNGDGLPDLLVGQFGQGVLRIYLNGGTRTAPEFGEFTLFQAGGADGSVPSG
jgi:hypothetical protein